MRGMSWIIGVIMVLSSATASAESTTPWILSAKEAKPLLQSALIWDTRGATAFAWSHVKGSTRVKWTDFSETKKANRGNLLPRLQLQAALQAAGVRKNQPIIVLGDPVGGWGEEGRLVWMLRAVGHPSAAFVDGGFDALKAAGAELERATGASPGRGDLQVPSSLAYTVNRSQVKSVLGGASTIVDSREKREFDGATPYGEKRGGHVPGAQHLYYRDLLTKSGFLKPDTELRKLLRAAGITNSSDVVAYCTGGVRSAWIVAVMQHLGIAGAKNYAGSMWEWSAGADQDFPLE